MKAIVTAWGSLLLLLSAAWAQQSSPLEKYRKLEFPPKDENFAKGWRERVAAEFEIVNTADVTALRAALKDRDPFVRSLAARALGIRGDKDSADGLAELVRADPEYMVRLRAVESLGLLKMKPEAIELAKKDKQLGVQWAARLAAGQLRSPTDYAAQVREAYAVGIQPEVMAAARVGKRAPDFTALTSEGKPFKLSSVLGKKPIALYFAAYEG
jgi:HEAT repeat protein